MAINVINRPFLAELKVQLYKDRSKNAFYIRKIIRIFASLLSFKHTQAYKRRLANAAHPKNAILFSLSGFFLFGFQLFAFV